MRTSVLFLCAISALSALAERQPYERYQTIVDRQMFGPPPPDFDPTKMPSEVAKSKGAKADQELTKEQEQVKKAIRFSVLNVTPAGETVVGFTDSADPKNPLHYYLKVGESQNGWTVREADKDAATMTIVNKDGIEVTLKLGGDSASNAAAVTRAGASASARPHEGAMGRGVFGGAGSLRERRRQREEQDRAEQARREEAEKVRAQQEAEDRKQREAERAEQREQLLRIQEELRKARELREAQKPASESEPESV